MNKKLITIFILLTIIPISLLTWIGITSIKKDKLRNQQNLNIIGSNRLENINNKIEKVFNRLELDLLKLDYLYTDNIDLIRKNIRSNELIQQVFLINQNNKIIYPSEKISLNNNEKDFLIRTKDLGLSTGLFLKSDSEKSTKILKSGWYTWFMGDGLNFIFWQKITKERDGALKYNTKNEKISDGNFILGIELNRIALLSYLIRNLPDTKIKKDIDFRISINDISNNIFYQWGTYSPKNKDKAISSMNLSKPLNTWFLKYFINPKSSEYNNKSSMLIVLLILFIILSIIFLVIYLYKESTKEIRDAMQKVSFVNQVSHELKTPLTNIKLYAELLEENLKNTNIKTKNYLDIIVSESNRLSRLISNVLSFAKKNKNGIQCITTENIPDVLIKHIINNFKVSLISKNIKVFLELNSNKSVQIDKDILDQILSNLINNVEKYAAAGGLIKIKTYFENNNLIIILEDNGPGIPRHLHNKVFKAFYRISNKLTDGVSGTGIGLSIVKKLAKIHQGDAKIIKSNKGTCFKITLYILENNKQEKI